MYTAGRIELVGRDPRGRRLVRSRDHRDRRDGRISWSLALSLPRPTRPYLVWNVTSEPMISVIDVNRKMYTIRVTSPEFLDESLNL